MPKSKRKSGKRKAGKRKAGKRKARKGGKRKAKRSGGKRKARKAGKRRGKKRSSKKRGKKRGKRKAAREEAAEAKKPKRKKGKRKGGAKRGRKKGKRKGKRGGKRSSKRRGAPCTPAKADRMRLAAQRRHERELAKAVAKNQRSAAIKEKKLEKLQRKHEKQLAKLRAGEAARGSRRRRGKKRAVGRNPVGTPKHQGGGGMWEFLAGAAGVAAGGLLAIGVDRTFATHALVAGNSTSGSTTTTTYTDQPGAGQVYDSQGPNTAIWSSWKRVVGAVASVLAPLGASALVDEKEHPTLKSGFQLAFFGAFVTTLTKVALDGSARLLGSTGMGARLLAPEAAASAQLGAQQAANATALAALNLSPATNAAGNATKMQAGSGSAMLAGTPQQRQVGAASMSPGAPSQAALVGPGALKMAEGSTTGFPRQGSGSSPPSDYSPPSDNTPAPPVGRTGGSPPGPGGLPPQPAPPGPIVTQMPCYTCGRSQCGGDCYNPNDPSGELSARDDGPSDQVAVD